MLWTSLIVAVLSSPVSAGRYCVCPPTLGNDRGQVVCVLFGFLPALFCCVFIPDLYFLFPLGGRLFLNKLSHPHTLELPSLMRPVDGAPCLHRLRGFFPRVLCNILTSRK